MQAELAKWRLKWEEVWGKFTVGKIWLVPKQTQEKLEVNFKFQLE